MGVVVLKIVDNLAWLVGQHYVAKETRKSFLAIINRNKYRL